MSKQPKNNKLDYLIDPTVNKANRLFVLSVEHEDVRTYFIKYFTPNVEVKDFK